MNYENLRCVKGGKVCPTHQNHTYLRWACGDVYSSKERHERFIASKHKCAICSRLTSKQKCQLCAARISAEARRGIPLPDWWCKKISDGQKGELGNKWKGDAAGYSSIHKHIRKNYGNPPCCEWCELPGKSHKGKWNIHWANKTGEYSRDISDWIGLCWWCHAKQGKTVVLKKKHYLS